jgi:hypothetical protein
MSIVRKMKRALVYPKKTRNAENEYIVIGVSLSGDIIVHRGAIESSYLPAPTQGNAGSSSAAADLTQLQSQREQQNSRPEDICWLYASDYSSSGPGKPGISLPSVS